MNKQLTTTKEKNRTGIVLVIVFSLDSVVAKSPLLKCHHLTKIVHTSGCMLQHHLLHITAAGAVWSTLPVHDNSSGVTFNLVWFHIPPGSPPATFYTLHNYMVLFYLGSKLKCFWRCDCLLLFRLEQTPRIYAVILVKYISKMLAIISIYFVFLQFCNLVLNVGEIICPKVSGFCS